MFKLLDINDQIIIKFGITKHHNTHFKVKKFHQLLTLNMYKKLPYLAKKYIGFEITKESRFIRNNLSKIPLEGMNLMLGSTHSIIINHSYLLDLNPT